MLNFLVYVIGMLLLFANIFGLTLALIWHTRSVKLKYLIGIASLLGIIVASVIYVAKRLWPKQVLRFLTTLNRQFVTASWLIVTLAFLIFLIYVIVAKRKQAAETDVASLSCHVLLVLALILFAISILPWLAHILPQLLLKTGEFVAFNEESISTGTLFRFIGYALACLLAFLTSLSFFQAYLRLPKKFIPVLAIINYFILLLDLSVRGVSSAARLGLLSSRNDFIFSIMIFEDKSQPYFAIAYGFIALLVAGFVYISHLKLAGEFKTPAMRRKAAWWHRNCRRWSKSLLIFSLLCVLSLTVVHDYITKPVELTPPEDYQLQGEQIIVDLKKVEDGHLHRFAYMYDQHNIRFIVVRKPNSNAYGVGLDACAICGIAGYFERGDTVVCKRCDVVMNKATIGFYGGCNPVPFPYEVKDGRIVINKADLEKEANRFPVGA